MNTNLDISIFGIVNGSRGSPAPPSSDVVVVDKESKESDCEIASTKLEDTNQQPESQFIWCQLQCAQRIQ